MGHWNRVARVKSRTKSMHEGWTKDESRWTESLWVGGETLTPSEIVARLQKNRHYHDYVDMCRVGLACAIATRDEHLDQEQKFHEDLTSVLRQQLGPDLARLKRYGVPPVKRRGPLSAEAGAIAKARERDTRRARGTMGSRQREAITTEPKPQVVISGLEGASKSDAPSPSRDDPRR